MEMVCLIIITIIICRYETLMDELSHVFSLPLQNNSGDTNDRYTNGH